MNKHHHPTAAQNAAAGWHELHLILDWFFYDWNWVIPTIVLVFLFLIASADKS